MAADKNYGPAGERPYQCFMGPWEGPCETTFDTPIAADGRRCFAKSEMVDLEGTELHKMREGGTHIFQIQDFDRVRKP